MEVGALHPVYLRSWETSGLGWDRRRSKQSRGEQGSGGQPLFKNQPPFILARMEWNRIGGGFGPSVRSGRPQD